VKSICRIFAIAKLTLSEAIRNRVLNILLIFALVTILSSRLFEYFRPGEEIKMIKDVGLASIVFFSALIAIFATSSLIPREIEKGTIFATIAKPVHRFEIVLGKYFGSILVTLLSILIMTFFFSLLIFFKQQYVETGIFIAIFLTFLEMAVITAITICVSTRFSVIFTSAFGFLMYISGHFSANIRFMAEKLGEFWVRLLVNISSGIIPNLEMFNVRSAVVLGIGVPAELIARAIAYCAIYTCAALIIGCVTFDKREL
jgi:ABC-type transport system involved in multi-copper enzyme maturation permease subunit